MGKHLSIADTAFLGRTGGSITPASFAGLQGWWKANDLVLANNDPVSSWADASGNTRTMLQATGANQPLFKTAIYNGLPTVRYDGTNDTLALASTVALAGAFTLLLVGAVTLTNSLAFGTFNAGKQARLKRGGIDDMNLFDGSSELTSGGGWTFPVGDLKLFIWKRTAATNVSFGQDVDIRLNLALAGAFTFEVLGGGAASTIPYGGDISEACFYNAEVSNTDIITLYNSYFKPKWGLP